MSITEIQGLIDEAKQNLIETSEFIRGRHGAVEDALRVVVPMQMANLVILREIANLLDLDPMSGRDILSEGEQT